MSHVSVLHNCLSLGAFPHVLVMQFCAAGLDFYDSIKRLTMSQYIESLDHYTVMEIIKLKLHI